MKIYEQVEVKIYEQVEVKIYEQDYVYVYVRIIFRTPGVYKKISDCCHDIHMVA